MSVANGRKRLLHVVSGLLEGGAEWMLYRLLRLLPEHGIDSEVLSLSDTEPMGQKMRDVGVPVDALGLDRSRPRPWALMSLAAEIRRRRPDAVQSWMYHADLAAGIAARLAGGPPVAWGLHHTELEESCKTSTLRAARTCARLSRRLPQRIVCCSEATRAAHAAMGYDESKLLVIANGFDTSEFRPDASARADVRSELRLGPGVPLVGMVARFAPDKDHANVFAAAAVVAAREPSARFVLCGRDVAWTNKELFVAARAAGVERQTVLLGSRSDVPRILSALDVYVSSSRSEALPLVVGEAMASGVPCVVTDVGDSAAVVGDTGIVVPPRDHEALGAGIIELLSLSRTERARRGEAARERIRSKYSLEVTAAAYAALYHGLVPAAGIGARPPGSEAGRAGDGAGQPVRRRRARSDRRLRSARRASS